MPRPMLGPSSRWTVHVLATLLVTTGAAWLVAHFGRQEDALPSPIEAWSMKIHGAAAMFTIFVFGTMVHRHVFPGWRVQRNRVAGFAMCTTLVLLILTGYGLYYFDGETLRRVAEWFHWGVGFVFPVVLATHVVAARMSRRK